MADEIVSIRVVISGKVQGVGYRHWTERRAMGEGLSGFVRNRVDGTVEAVFSGPRQAVDDMLARCKVGPRTSSVMDIQVEPWSGSVAEGFKVLPTA